MEIMDKLCGCNHYAELDPWKQDVRLDGEKYYCKNAIPNDEVCDRCGYNEKNRLP